MAVKIFYTSAFLSEEGQSILEVVFVIPLLFAFIALIYKMNMASQAAINNIQYLRTQLFVLANNSSEYPRLQFRFKKYGGPFAKEGHVRMVLGVSDPEAVKGQMYSDDPSALEAIPILQKINRPGTSVTGSQDAGEVSSRTEVRIRNTASICTQFNNVRSGSIWEDAFSNIWEGQNRRWPFNATPCRYEEPQ
jgi:hypothetical protein